VCVRASARIRRRRTLRIYTLYNAETSPGTHSLHAHGRVRTTLCANTNSKPFSCVSLYRRCRTSPLRSSSRASPCVYTYYTTRIRDDDRVKIGSLPSPRAETVVGSIARGQSRSRKQSREHTLMCSVRWP